MHFTGISKVRGTLIEIMHSLGGQCDISEIFKKARERNIPEEHIKKELRNLVSDGKLSVNFMGDFVNVNLEDFVLFLHPRDHEDGTDRAFRAGKVYEPYETQCHKMFLRKGDTCIDVGANLGYYSFLYAKYVGNTGKVISFEPELENFSLLQRGILANNFANISAYQAAVGAKQETLTLYKSKDNLGDHRTWETSGREKVQIACVSLDKFLQDLPKVDFLKVDTQGYEILVLMGAQQLIKRSPNLILALEYWPLGIKGSGGTQQAFSDTLSHLGFTKIFAMDEVDQKMTDVSEYLSSLSCKDSDDWVINLICMKG